MKTIHAFGVAALLGVAAIGSAGAQTGATPPGTAGTAVPAQPSTSPGTATSPAPSTAATPSPSVSATAQAPAGLAAGQKIYSSEGTEIGSVAEVTTGANGGVVITLPASGGAAEKKVHVPAGDLRARAGGGFTTNATADRLRAMPAHGG